MPQADYADLETEGTRLLAQLRAFTADLERFALVTFKPGYTAEGMPKATATIRLPNTKVRARNERAKRQHQEAVRGLATHASNPCPRGPGRRR